MFSPSLFPNLSAEAPRKVALAPGAVWLRGFALEQAPALLEGIRSVSTAAPFRHLVTPGGFSMSVGMSSCGATGWVSDRSGYRYAAKDPESGLAWPEMPPAFLAIAVAAAEAAGFPDYAPDCCLLNRYAVGTRLTMHQDRNERRDDAPIVSVSLGLPATFLFGGLNRSDRPARLLLVHGDVVVWGGPARMNFHGVLPVAAGEDPRNVALRYNLTFRRAL